MKQGLKLLTGKKQKAHSATMDLLIAAAILIIVASVVAAYVVFSSEMVIELQKAAVIGG